MAVNVATGQPYIFISYASADRERVLPIVAALREAGISCWLDQHEIEGGANWGLRIAEAIEGCAALVLMSSAASLASRNVRQEIALAWRYEKPYLPFRLDLTPVPNEIVYWLETAQWIDIFDHPEPVWLPKVQQAIQRLLSQPDSRSVPPATDAFVHPVAGTNLPSPLSSFVGRDREVMEVAGLLQTERVVTITGPGGIGKTRIGIAVGHRMVDAYQDGVVLVDLTPLTDPALVLATIAARLNVRETTDQPIREQLASALRHQRLLLILDNVEQVIDVAADLGWLVARCPTLAILCTSRESLRISGENEYSLAPLPVPDVARVRDIEALRGNPTVALFVQRARAAKPGFDLTPENAATIVAICSRLDGLPLAIELAAARIRALSPSALLERLSDPLRFLTGGARDLPDRQRTIRDTIQWSYDLLPEDEQHLFRRLSVFVGGWTLESVEAVVSAAGDLGIDLFDGLTSLVDKSLVMQQEQADDNVRFTMLATIREFGEDHLNAANEADATRLALAHYIDAITLDVERHMGQMLVSVPLLDRLQAERDNLRAVLHWCQQFGSFDREWALLGLRIAVHSFAYWDGHGGVVEGKPWLEMFAAHDDLPADLRARAYGRAAEFALQHREVQRANCLAERAVLLADECGDVQAQVETRIWLAECRHAIGRHDVAVPLLTESLALSQSAGLTSWTGVALMIQQTAAVEAGDYERVQALAAACIAATQDDHNLVLWSIVTYEVARVAFARGDVALAEREARRALEWSQVGHYAITEAESLVLLARVLHERGVGREAIAAGARGARLLQRVGTPGQVADHLVALAVIAAESKHPAVAAQMLAVADAQYHRMTIREHDRLEGHRVEMVARTALGDVTFERIQHEARTMSLDDAVAAVIAAFTTSSAA